MTVTNEPNHEQEQYSLWLALKASDPIPNPDSLYDTWASALHEAGVRATGGAA